MKLLPLALFAMLAAALGILQASFMPSMPHALSSVDLPLLLICWRIMRFRFREAMTCAIVAGVVMDMLALTSLSRTAAYAAVALSAWMLFTRVFTNRSWPGLLGLTAVSYALLHLLITAERLVHAALDGLPLAAAFQGAGFGAALAALGLQLAATVAILAVGARSRASASFADGRG